MNINLTTYKNIKKLKCILTEIKKQALQGYLENVMATKDTDYSLWKITKKLKNTHQQSPPLRTNTGE